MARILVTDPLDAEGLALLRARGHEVVETRDDGAKAREVPKAEAWLLRSGTRITAQDIAAAKRLRAIGRAGVGVDNVDLAAATQRGIAVFHAPTGNITSAAEQAWALMLACARRVPEADRSMKEGRWARKDLEGAELAGKTLLIVGLGRIGRMMARRAQAFEMRTIGHDPFVTPEAAKGFGVEWVALEEGLSRSDIVTLHTPLTPQTQNLLDARRIALLRPRAILVNAARGGLVEPAPLLEALESGRLRSAGLDVWSDEPP
ncbi:MAG TPA: hydroxyacid dehydrogenase, partial [Candidatus Thermoplasmatota archaeon]|nr:hydroxyacid dehydrogenase [Candidatus Thermoplasmatota archaeon]